MVARRFALLGVLVTVVLGASGCAASMAQWRDVHCNYDAAYASGLNTFQQGEALNVDTYGECPVEGRATALRGYREGYEGAMNASRRGRPRPAAVVIPPSYESRGWRGSH